MLSTRGLAVGKAREAIFLTVPETTQKGVNKRSKGVIEAQTTKTGIAYGNSLSEIHDCILLYLTFFFTQS